MTNANAPMPSDVLAYLRATGWTLSETRGSWRTFEKLVDGQAAVIEVPIASGAPDYGRVVMRLLKDLEILEQRPTDVIERDIRSSAFDVVRLRLIGALHNGRIPVESGAKVFHAARDLMLAAACSVIYPQRPMFTRRKPQQAMDYLRAAKFAPTESGSFVLSIESAVRPKLKPAQTEHLRSQERPVDDEPEPFERGVGLKLASGVTTSRRLVDEIAADESSDSVVAAIEQGVNSNLCEAIASLVAPDVAETLEVSVRWSGLWPSPLPPSTTTFSSSSQNALLSMASTLRDAGVYDDCDVVGPVLRLISSDLDVGGTVQIRMMDEPARLRKVSATLDSASYKLAVAAHAAKRWFSCTGELTHSKGAYHLMNARNPKMLAEIEDSDDAERPF